MLQIFNIINDKVIAPNMTNLFQQFPKAKAYYRWYTRSKNYKT